MRQRSIETPDDLCDSHTRGTKRFASNGEIEIMKCDLCKDADDGEGIHYHAFIDGKHHWVCEGCKAKLHLKDDHTDDVDEKKR